MLAGVWLALVALTLLGAFYALTIPLTVVLEGGALVLYAWRKRISMRWLLPAVCAANLLTQFGLVTMLYQFGELSAAGWLLAEGVIVLVEGVWLSLLFPKTFHLRRALGLSLGLNVFSFLVGLFLPI